MVKRLEQKVHFVDREKPGSEITVTDPNGKPLYLLQCYLNAYEREHRDFDYSGSFECRLTSRVSEDPYGTLLTDEFGDVRDWQSRGRFLMTEITGDCAKYPEYGLHRTFRLRAMQLTLEVSNLKVDLGSAARDAPWGIDRIGSLDLRVTVVPDPTADLEIAELPPNLPPPQAHPDDPNDASLDCRTVLMRDPRRPYPE